jgi:hypothetical protein
MLPPQIDISDKATALITAIGEMGTGYHPLHRHRAKPAP